MNLTSIVLLCGLATIGCTKDPSPKEGNKILTIGVNTVTGAIEQLF